MKDQVFSGRDVEEALAAASQALGVPRQPGDVPLWNPFEISFPVRIAHFTGKASGVRGAGRRPATTAVEPACLPPVPSTG